MTWHEEFLTPKFFVALAALAVFGWAYGENVGDETMKGAIIGGFNLALGFYLGSNSTAAQATNNTGKAFDAIRATAGSARHDLPSGTPDDPVSVTEARP